MSPAFVLSRLALPCLVVGAYAQNFIGPVGDLFVTNKVIAPDGYPRSAVVVDGQYPAPLIKANKGDRFQFNVHDLLTDNTMERALTIHWHGLYQKKTNWADGVAFVTQCPLVPGESFLYDFTPSGQAGTFWYHSHFSEQYCDGLRGPMVIYDPDDPFKDMYDVDDESTVLTISDWQHLPTSQLAEFPLNISSTLINGKGRYIGGPQADLAIITVEKGKRYRMRLVSISCDPNFIVWIDGHNMTVIEADGVDHEPVTVGSLQIFAGQRYSFILDANQPIGNYWIRSQTGPNVPGIVGVDGGVNSAILRYIGADDLEPNDTKSVYTNLLNETQLHPLVNPEAPGNPWPGGADVTINLPAEVVGVFALGGEIYQSPTIPILLQILNGVPPQNLLPNGSVYTLPPNKVIEVSFPMINLLGSPHPMHLHGHTFSVIRSAGTGPDGYNFKVSLSRTTLICITGDTTGDNVTIRFVTDNAGPWFLHCHIDYHLNAGFAAIMAEDVPDVPDVDTPVPPGWDLLCPAYNAFAGLEPCIGNQCAKNGSYGPMGHRRL
ncbi:laccase hybrid [Gloeophyllum trabeum ATCC 11539]|uniref:Laccase hybrid n=1 Tax=Gloeophyllum trabeum (strain ATCC 11539 / FP-39264 / Madison 617) TaxID=670483 RepID=S7Q2E4_GLOTA|nr:laccase hybrid [Gloeophyllum trabeum ATCC 11539]EPQ54176.1 laccase hybrid [Gloeophyllum trabeum ATCC 11539]